MFDGLDEHDFVDMFMGKYYDKIKETKRLPGYEEPIEKEFFLRIKTLSRILFITYDVFEYADKISENDHRFVFAAENTEEGIKTQTYDYNDFNAGNREKTYTRQSSPDYSAIDILSSCVLDDDLTTDNIYEVMSDIVWEWLFKVHFPKGKQVY